MSLLDDYEFLKMQLDLQEAELLHTEEKFGPVIELENEIHKVKENLEEVTKTVQEKVASQFTNLFSENDASMNEAVSTLSAIGGSVTQVEEFLEDSILEEQFTITLKSHSPPMYKMKQSDNEKIERAKQMKEKLRERLIAYQEENEVTDPKSFFESAVHIDDTVQYYWNPPVETEKKKENVYISPCCC